MALGHFIPFECVQSTQLARLRTTISRPNLARTPTNILAERANGENVIKSKFKLHYPKICHAGTQYTLKSVMLARNMLNQSINQSINQLKS